MRGVRTVRSHAHTRANAGTANIERGGNGNGDGELAELARQAFDAHTAGGRIKRRACASSSSSSNEVSAGLCSWYRGQFAVMVKSGRAHRSEWHSFINEVIKLERKS